MTTAASFMMRYFMKYRVLTLALLFVLGACTDDTSDVAPSHTNNSTPDMTSVEDMGTDTQSEPDIPKTPGSLLVEVDTITFEKVRKDETKTVTVGLSNTGEEDIVISRVELGEIDRIGDPEFKAGPNWINSTTILEGGTFKTLDVVYAPNDFETDRGLLEITSNDPENPVITIRLESLNPYADLDAPNFLRMGNVAATTTKTERVNLYNRGDDPLTINSVTYAGLGKFAVSFEATQTPPYVVQRNELFVFDVTFSPTNDEVNRGTITIESSDLDDGTFEMSIKGNDPTSCISVTPRVVDFGEMIPNQASDQVVTVFNCSNMIDLSVTNIELANDAGGTFSLAALPVFPVLLSGFDVQMFNVSATIAEGERIGDLEVSSDAVGQSPVRLELRARAAE